MMVKNEDPRYLKSYHLVSISMGGNSKLTMLGNLLRAMNSSSNSAYYYNSETPHAAWDTSLTGLDINYLLDKFPDIEIYPTY